MIIKLLLGLLLAGLGAFQLMRAAGIEIRFRPPAEEQSPATTSRSSNVTGIDLRSSVGKIISKAKSQVGGGSASSDSTSDAGAEPASPAPEESSTSTDSNADESTPGPDDPGQDPAATPEAR